MTTMLVNFMHPQRLSSSSPNGKPIAVAPDGLPLYKAPENGNGGPRQPDNDTTDDDNGYGNVDVDTDGRECCLPMLVIDDRV